MTILRHTSSDYEADLEELRRRLLKMAGRVDTMISQSVQSLVNRDSDLASETIRMDAQVNTDEVELDRMCMALLACRQPMASDLRFITITLKMVTDLERIADLAVNICERSIQLKLRTCQRRTSIYRKWTSLYGVCWRRRSRHSSSEIFRQPRCCSIVTMRSMSSITKCFDTSLS